MGATLDQRARDAIIPQPIVFEVDSVGNHHFATEQLPWRTVIDIQALPMWPHLRIDHKAATVTIALDGRTVVYRRRGYTFRRSEWICDLERQ